MLRRRLIFVLFALLLGAGSGCSREAITLHDDATAAKDGSGDLADTGGGADLDDALVPDTSVETDLDDALVPDTSVETDLDDALVSDTSVETDLTDAVESDQTGGGDVAEVAAPDLSDDANVADIGEKTPCGDTSCDSATEICIEGNFGGPTSIGCKPVPLGCDVDRSCACVAATYCNTGLALCENKSPNHIFCDTGLD
ncbi:MAG: hypothetical protein KC609_18210 [Myxococcales bacterium]|nr:hypothetical protein [Myxococcales bacterium]